MMTEFYPSDALLHQLKHDIVSAMSDSNHPLVEADLLNQLDIIDSIIADRPNWGPTSALNIMNVNIH
jgi:hypothetical protein